jgi:hypothetical protein
MHHTKYKNKSPWDDRKTVKIIDVRRITKYGEHAVRSAKCIEKIGLEAQALF